MGGLQWNCDELHL